MNVAVLDAARLPPGVQFPPLKAAKYGWQEYPRLTEGEIAENCWRAHVILTLSTPLDAATLAALPMLKLVIEACDGLVDLEAAAARGVAVARLPSGLEGGSLCHEAVETIDAFLEGAVRHRLI